MTLTEVQEAEEARHAGAKQAFKPPTQEQYAAKLNGLPALWRRTFGDLAWYRKEYAAGYATAQRTSESRKYNSGEYSWAWEDGYLDAAAGRGRWHLAHCPNHDECGWG